MRKRFLKETVVASDVFDVEIPSIEPVSVSYTRSNGSVVPTGYKSYVNILTNPERIFPIKSLKSGRYNELDHRKTFDTVLAELRSLKEEVKLYGIQSNSDYSEITADFLIDKPFSLDQVPFEFNLKNAPGYTKGYDSKEADIFYPLISVTNSFLNCSEVSFNLYRRICANGMLMGKLLDKKISFRHFGDVSNRFNDETQKFIMSIFEKRFVDSIFETYSQKEVQKDAFAKFMAENLGKRVEKDIVEDVTFQLPKEFSAWVGLQALTFFTTNKINDRIRGINALKNYSKMLNIGGV